MGILFCDHPSQSLLRKRTSTNRINLCTAAYTSNTTAKLDTNPASTSAGKCAPRLTLEIPTHKTKHTAAIRHLRLNTGHRLATTSMANDECPLGRLWWYSGM